MGNVVGGKVYVSPGGGKWKVRIFRHGFVAPVTDIPEHIGQMIEEYSAMAVEMLGSKAARNPFKVFELMGWTEEKEAAERGEKGE